MVISPPYTVRKMDRRARISPRVCQKKIKFCHLTSCVSLEFPRLTWSFLDSSGTLFNGSMRNSFLATNTQGHHKESLDLDF